MIKTMNDIPREYNMTVYFWDWNIIKPEFRFRDEYKNIQNSY